jgi:hypothetical protein
MSYTPQNIQNLIEQGNWKGLALASQLVKGLGYPPLILHKVIEKIILQYLHEFMPDMDYHRFGCSIIDKMTFDLVYKKLNEFLEVPVMEVEVCSDFLMLKSYVKTTEKEYQLIEIYFEEFTNSLFYSIRASFKIGNIPSEL